VGVFRVCGYRQVSVEAIEALLPGDLKKDQIKAG